LGLRQVLWRGVAGDGNGREKAQNSQEPIVNSRQANAKAVSLNNSLLKLAIDGGSYSAYKAVQ
jgi:hypothetical protein